MSVQEQELRMEIITTLLKARDWNGFHVWQVIDTADALMEYVINGRPAQVTEKETKT